MNFETLPTPEGVDDANGIGCPLAAVRARPELYFVAGIAAPPMTNE